MARRQLYLAAYDITAPRRQQRVRKILRAYATGGQRSAYECWLSEAEASSVHEDAAAIIDAETDRFFLLRLDPRSRFLAFGLGQPPQFPQLFYIG